MGSGQEVNLKLFLQKVYKHKKFFLISIGSAVLLALLYIALATPKYEVATSILIDPSGSNRALGESQYVVGGVSLIEMEKNLYNEIGIIKSFSLINQTIKELNLDISYYEPGWLKGKERYGDLPFVVLMDRDKPQLLNVPFEIEFVSDTRFKVEIDADDFEVYDPKSESIHDVKRSIALSKNYGFGEPIFHEYFSFTLDKPDYSIRTAGLKGQVLRFELHSAIDVTKGRMNDLTVDNIDIQASIFRLMSTGPIVAKETAFLNGLTKNYIDNKLQSRNEIASSKESFIRDQLAVITDSLMSSELELESFKKGNAPVNLSETASNAMTRTRGLQASIAKLRLDVQNYEQMIDYVEQNRNSSAFVLPNSQSIEDPMITQNISELQTLYAERSRKRFFVTGNNEEMNILNEQIRQSTQKLLTNLGNALASANTQLNGVRATLSSYDQLITSLPTREKQLLSLERQSALYENLFNYLSQELAKTGIARAENTSDTQVLDEARMEGDAPVAPQKGLLMVLALVIGALVPTAWLVWFAPEDIIENEDQIRSISKIPLIASVVHHDPETGSDTSLWQVKESFRDLSANLRFVCAKNGCIIGLTSIMPEEGKTYCSINLGITFAEAGKKTLIIDTDLRKPSLIKGIQKVEGGGLSDYLDGSIKKIGNIIYQHPELANLEFIPTSVAEGNVHELLSGGKMKDLFQELKGKYDYIILDTPAAGLVSDVLLLWEAIDINLYVVRREIARIGFLKDLENLDRKGKKKKKSFIIFNDALKKDFKYGYGPKYGLNQEKQLVNDSLTV